MMRSASRSSEDRVTCFLRSAGHDTGVLRLGDRYRDRTLAGREPWQFAVPPGNRGRVNAGYRLALWGLLSLASIAGGMLVAAVGPRAGAVSDPRSWRSSPSRRRIPTDGS
jgi:hypothetical protein